MLTFDKNQKSHFLELFDCKVKQGYEIYCTYYLRCYSNTKTIFNIIFVLKNTKTEK